MGESQTVVTLRTKVALIERTIERYEEKLARARADLAHVSAALVIFEASGDPIDIQRYANLRRFFRYREMFSIARDALEREGPLTTAQITERVMRAKGLDADDPVLARMIGLKVVQNLTMHLRRGNLAEAGRQRFWRMRVWKLPSASL